MCSDENICDKAEVAALVIDAGCNFTSGHDKAVAAATDDDPWQ